MAQTSEKFEGVIGTSHEQKQDDANLINSLHKLRSIGRDYIAPHISLWARNVDYYNEKQWDRELLDTMALWRSAPVDNIIFQTVETMHSLLTDQRPEGFAFARAGGSANIAELLSGHIRQLHDDLEIERKNSTKWRQKLMKGIGWWKVFWDASRKRIETDQVNPENMIFDPLATEVKDMRFIGEKKRISLAELLETYPDLYDRLVEVKSSDTELRTAFEHIRSGAETVASDVDVWEIWFKDATLEIEANGTDSTDGETIKQRKRKYPNGRVVKFVGDVKLEDNKNPYKWEGSEQLWPYVKDHLIEQDGEPVGISLVSTMISGQDIINTTEQKIQDNLNTVVNSFFVTKKGAIDIDEFTNAPSTVIEVEGEEGAVENSFKVVNGTNISSDAFKYLQNKKADLKELVGLTDAITGNVAASQRPGAVKAAFESSMTRLREMIRQDNRAMATMAEMQMDLMQQFYEVDRTIYLMDKNSDTTDVSTPAAQALVREVMADPEIQKELRRPVRDITVNETNESFKQGLAQQTAGGQVSEAEARAALRAENIIEFKNNIQEGRYKYRIDIHPLQARDKSAFADQVIQLLQFAGPAAPTMLKHAIKLLDIPESATIISEMEQVSQLQAQVEQLTLQLQQSQQGTVPQTAQAS